MRALLLAVLSACLFAMAAPGAAHAQSVAGYDKYGRLLCMKYASGRVTKYYYDDAGNRTSVVTSGSGTCSSDATGSTPPTVPGVSLTALNPSATVASAGLHNFGAAALGTASDSSTLTIISASTSGSAGSCGASSFTASTLSYSAPTTTTALTCGVTYTLRHTSGLTTTGLATYAVSAGSGGGGSGGGGSGTANPVAVNDSVYASAEYIPGSSVTPTISFDPRSNDTDADLPGDVLTITGKTNGTVGSVTIQGGGTSVTWTKNSSVNAVYNSVDYFTYTITDQQGHTSTATVTVNIQVTEGCTPNPQTGICDIE